MKNDKQKEDKSSSVAAGVAGGIIGAGAALAAEALLKNKDNQEKIQGAVDTAKEKAADVATKIKDKVVSEKKEMLPSDTEVKKEVEKITNKDS